MEHFDLIVIGGGPSGYAGAMRAIDFGKKVLLIEKKKLGGAGVYDGVLTSKTLWEYSMKVSATREMVPGFKVNFEEMEKTVNEAVFERKTQMTVHSQLLQNSSNRLFYYEKGQAQFIDKNTIQITKEDSAIKKVSADFILVATGSSPRPSEMSCFFVGVFLTRDGPVIEVCQMCVRLSLTGARSTYSKVRSCSPTVSRAKVQHLEG